MKISKLKIKNLFGINEFEADEKSIELLGANGTGKTSVLDSIRLALTNKTDREYTVKNGETEGEIYIEFDNGIAITRKPRTNKTDYKKITQNGKEIQKPEEFLNQIFSKLQLDPVEFMELDTKEYSTLLRSRAFRCWASVELSSCRLLVESWPNRSVLPSISTGSV